MEFVCFFFCLLPSSGKRIHIQTVTDGRDLLSTPLRWAEMPKSFRS
jgi:hypothetical protein